MKTRSKWLLRITAILALLAIFEESSSVKAASRDQGMDRSKHQGYSGIFGYSSDEFVIAQIGGTVVHLITQATYNSQITSAKSHGFRAYTYIWYGIGSSITNGCASLNYFLPRVKTPKGSIVALDYKGGTSSNKAANTTLSVNLVKELGISVDETDLAISRLEFHRIIKCY